MPSRIIREGILTSHKINAISPLSELFYRRLMSVVDDYGRYEAHPSLLRASCYPLKLDSVKEDSIKKHLTECVDAGLIVLFTVAGKNYLQINEFNQRIQSKSKFPDPPAMEPAGKGDEKPSVPVDSSTPPCSTVIHGDSRTYSESETESIKKEIDKEKYRNLLIVASERILKAYPKPSTDNRAAIIVQEAIWMEIDEGMEPEKAIELIESRTKRYKEITDEYQHKDRQYIPFSNKWFSERRYNQNEAIWQEKIGVNPPLTASKKIAKHEDREYN